MTPLIRSISRLVLLLSLGLLPFAASAQTAANASTSPSASGDDSVVVSTTAAEEAAAAESDNPLVQFPNQRPPDQRGLNTFEPPKTESRLVGNTPQLRIGAGFAQQFQALDHSNAADEVLNPQGDET